MNNTREPNLADITSYATWMKGDSIRQLLETYTKTPIESFKLDGDQEYNDEGGYYFSLSSVSGMTIDGREFSCNWGEFDFDGNTDEAIGEELFEQLNDAASDDYQSWNRKYDLNPPFKMLIVEEAVA